MALLRDDEAAGFKLRSLILFLLLLLLCSSFDRRVALLSRFHARRFGLIRTRDCFGADRVTSTSVCLSAAAAAAAYHAEAFCNSEN